jgi:hypothetical protein
MGAWLENCLNSGGERIGLSLEDGSAAAFDLISSMGQTAEERADFLADSGFGAEASVGGHLSTEPAPDMLIGIEIRAVRWQTDTTELQVRRGQVGTQRIAWS